jgi:hypothetical protein
MPHATQRFFCPCCKYRTLPEQPPGTFNVCPVCFWEDERVQFEDPSLRGGANEVSLVEAQENFRRFGAAAERCLPHVRPPRPDEVSS